MIVVRTLSRKLNHAQTGFGLRDIPTWERASTSSNTLLQCGTLPIIGWAEVHPTTWRLQRVMDLAVVVPVVLPVVLPVVVLVFMVLLQL